MSSKQEIGTSPLRVAGDDITVSLTADHFWRWQTMAEAAEQQLHNDPAAASRTLQQLIEMLARKYAEARKDDPTLPSYWQQFLA